MGVRMRAVLAALLLGPAACSASDPVPSPLYDGTYTGVRESDQAAQCGVAALHGSTTARVKSGHVSMGLFSPKTVLTGTVGEDGSVRASGIWANPTGGFPGMTVLTGRISGKQLDGTATDFRCHTDVKLRRVTPGAKARN